MKYIRLLLILTSIIAIIANEVTFINILLLVLSTVFSLVFTLKYNIHGNYAKYLILTVYWISIVFMPAFHLIDPIIKHYEEVTQLYYNKLQNFGIPIYSFLIFLLVIIGNKKREINVLYQPAKISTALVSCFLLGCIALSLFCYSIGLGRMGGEAVVLPFHLSGIINFFRNTMLPVMFAVIIENFHIRKVKVKKQIWVLYIFWCLVETIAWLSKAVLITRLLNVIVVLYIYHRPSIRSLIKYLSPIVAVFLFLYPIVELMRYTDKSSNALESYKEARIESDENGFHLTTPINRVFMFGAQYVQNQDYISDNFFDFSKVPVLVMMGGAARYQTVVIDGYPEDAVHSSGTSGFMDLILHGGVGLLYIFTAVFAMLACCIDKFFSKRMISIYTSFLLALFGLVLFGNVSTLYDSIGLQSYLVSVISISIAYRLNFYKRLKSESKIKC